MLKKKTVAHKSKTKETSVTKAAKTRKVALKKPSATAVKVFKSRKKSVKTLTAKVLPKKEKKISSTLLPTFEKKETPQVEIVQKPLEVSLPQGLPQEKQEEKKETPAPAVVTVSAPRVIEVEFPITLRDLAVKFQEKPSVLIKKLMEKGILAGINQNLDQEIVQKLADNFGFQIQKAKEIEESLLELHRMPDETASLKRRPPIVTFMGHVDHGKTSLLDAIRKTKVAESEHGGITQHIGAYQIKIRTKLHPEKEDYITFLDTPGHEAFTRMRARGARITDIVVLVVAADEGVMPQTVEAINHAREAKVPIMVAINKIDKPSADIEIVKKQLAEHGLVPEEWQGKTVMVGVSAKTYQGIDDLLELIILQAEMMELKANYEKLASGVVVESQISSAQGVIVTLLVQNGTLRLNDSLIVGVNYGKIKAMFDEYGRTLNQALPSMPVKVLGINGLPQAGDEFFVLPDDKQAKQLAQVRLEKSKQKQITPVKKINLEELSQQIKEGKIKELKVILKADTMGSLEAIKETITKINTSQININIIHEGIGDINTSDVLLASASNAIIFGFNIDYEAKAKELLREEGVEVKIYNIIYELSNDLKSALEGMLEPKTKKTFMGKAEVRKVFKLSKAGIVAGCFVLKGRITRHADIVLVRNGKSVYEGKISSLKRFKDDVREVTEGMECGISLGGLSDIYEGDILEAYEIQKIASKLE